MGSRVGPFRPLSRASTRRNSYPYYCNVNRGDFGRCDSGPMSYTVGFLNIAMYRHGGARYVHL